METIEIQRVKEIKELFPKPENYDEIKADIADRGIQEAVVVNTNDQLLCGYTRLSIAEELDIDEIPHRTEGIIELDEMKEYAILDNWNRRQLTELQMVECGMKLEKIYNGRQGGDRKSDEFQSGQNVHLEDGKTRDLVADKIQEKKGVKMSGRKYDRLKTIATKAVSEVKDKFNDGEITQKEALALAKVEPDEQNEIIQSGRSITKQVKTALTVPKVVPTLLEATSDRELMEALKIKLQLYDVWNFAECDSRFGQKYPGQIPGQLIANVLYYYTKQDDLVVDPMAGGGTTVDVCKKLKRRCYAYDLKPVRDDVTQHDITESLPNTIAEADLVFVDPPYWNMKDDDYSDESVSGKTLVEFNEWINSFVHDCYDKMKTDAKLAVLIMNQSETDIPEGKFYIDHIYHLQTAFIAAGFTIMRRIQCPLSSQVFRGYDVNRAKESKHIMGLQRDLIIGKKG